jgi:hypothetical protein
LILASAIASQSAPDSQTNNLSSTTSSTSATPSSSQRRLVLAVLVDFVVEKHGQGWFLTLGIDKPRY